MNWNWILSNLKGMGHGIGSTKVGKGQGDRSASLTQSPGTSERTPFVATVRLLLLLSPVASTNFFSTWRSGPNHPDAEYLERLILPTEGTGKSAFLPRTQQQTDGLFAVNLCPHHDCGPSNLFSHFNYLGTARYKHADVSISCAPCHLDGTRKSEASLDQVRPKPAHERLKRKDVQHG